MHGVVGLVGAVHAEHAQPLRIGGRIGAEAHQRRGDRKTGQVDELAQELGRARPGIDDAAAGIEERPLGLGDQLDRRRDGAGVALGARMVGLVLDVVRAGVDAGRELDVLGDVDQHRPRPAVRGDVEGLVEDAREVVDVADEPVVLGAGRVMPTVSHSWKASLPIRWVGTWPVMQTIGIESISASVSGVTMLVAPGPEVTSATPSLPVERA